MSTPSQVSKAWAEGNQVLAWALYQQVEGRTCFNFNEFIAAQYDYENRCKQNKRAMQNHEQSMQTV